MESWRKATQAERRLFLLISQVFTNHPKLLRFFFDTQEPRTSFEPHQLLKASGCFSSGEQVLIRVALDLWNESGGAQVRDLMYILDDESCSNVLKALENWRHSTSAN